MVSTIHWSRREITHLVNTASNIFFRLTFIPQIKITQIIVGVVGHSYHNPHPGALRQERLYEFVGIGLILLDLRPITDIKLNLAIFKSATWKVRCEEFTSKVKRPTHP